MRALYVDLDGTLFGPGGSLLRGPDGAFSLLGVRAIEACHRAGAEVVVMTGRRRVDAAQVMRVLGERSTVFEAGAGFELDGEVHWLLDAQWAPADGRTTHQRVADAGALALLLERFAGRLEGHGPGPWATDREVSHLLRGRVETAEAEQALVDAGITGLRLIDNGAMHHRTTGPGTSADDLRVYHLVPDGVSKARGVAAHAAARGYSRSEIVAAGDSLEDLEVAAVAGRFILTANAGPEAHAALKSYANATATDAGYGSGVYEAVVELLMAGR